jgi:hypothetical protein
MPTYEDLYNTRKTTEDIDNTFAATYEMATLERNHSEDDELTDEDKTAVAEHLKSVIPELQSFLDELTGQTTEETTMDDIAVTAIMKELSETKYPDTEEDEPDDCVRIALNIPVPPSLSEEEKRELERSMVLEAAAHANSWIVNNEIDKKMGPNMGVPIPESEDIDTDEELEEAEDEVEMPPEEVIRDIANKYNETYEQMRADYDEDFPALEFAVIECLIEDGYITPGHHYNVETETVEFMNGDTMSFVTGPKGSRTVKKEKDEK